MKLHISKNVRIAQRSAARLRTIQDISSLTPRPRRKDKTHNYKIPHDNIAQLISDSTVKGLCPKSHRTEHVMKRHFMTKQHKRAEYEPLTVLFEAAKKSRSEHETKYHCKRLEKRTRKKKEVQPSTLQIAGLRPCEGLNGSSSKIDFTSADFKLMYVRIKHYKTFNLSQSCKAQTKRQNRKEKLRARRQRTERRKARF